MIHFLIRAILIEVACRVIAEELIISTTTTKTHVAHILQKLGVSSRTLAIARAHALGLV